MLIIEPVAKNGIHLPFCKVSRSAYNGDSDELRKAIGCKWLEAAHIGGGITLWFDEEGRLNGKQFNQMATRLYGKDTIVGTACVLSNDDEGNEVDLTEEQEKLVLGWLGIDGECVAA